MSGWWAAWKRGPEPLIDPDPDVEGELSAKFRGPLSVIPSNRTEVYRTYGNPGTGKVDPRWERDNMVLATGLPGRWNNGKGRLYVHEKVEPYLREALRRASLGPLPPGGLLSQAVTPLNYITRLGCFSFRHQRHDPARPLSYHSWGIAVDINAEDNAGKYIKDPPEPFSAAWSKLYPRGVPKELVRAFESVGWRWGGRWKGFVDGMHFELVA